MNEKARKVKVISRNGGLISYIVPTLRIRRQWDKAGDENFIPIEELIELTTVPGGRKILEEYLIIDDEEAIQLVLGYDVAPEYRYTKSEIQYLLYEGTNEQFADCLDYAPLGVLEILKGMAIAKQPNTTFKVDAINKKFQINLDTLNRNYEAEEIFEEAVELTGRRAAPVEIPKKETPQQKYKVTGK